MKLVVGSYISNVTFTKSLDSSYDCFEAREGLSKDIFFTGYEENGKMKIIGNRRGLEKSVNGERNVIKIEKYINQLYKEMLKSESAIC